MSSESFPPDDGPKKSPMQSASLNGPCLLWMASILSNSGPIDPIAEPVTSLGFINIFWMSAITEFSHLDICSCGSHDGAKDWCRSTASVAEVIYRGDGNKLNGNYPKKGKLVQCSTALNVNERCQVAEPESWMSSGFGLCSLRGSSSVVPRRPSHLYMIPHAQQLVLSLKAHLSTLLLLQYFVSF